MKGMRFQRSLMSWLPVLLLAITLPLQAGKTNEEKNASPVDYLPIKPKLIVNLEGRRRYLRTDIQLMIDGKENLERIRQYLPIIRHSLIMLFSDLPEKRVTNLEQREKLRRDALQEVRKVLDRYAGSEGIEDILFTEFLVQ